MRVNGFFGHIQRNHLRSMVMFLGFAGACQLIGMAILIVPLMITNAKNSPILNFIEYMQSYGVAVFVLTSALFLFRFFLHVNGIKQNVHFELVMQMQEPRLCKIIEVQAIGAGIAIPRAGVIEDQARNAFACGVGERSSVIVVTRGLINALDDDELEAVVAHEITHIVNGDVQLMAVANVMLSTLNMFIKYNPVRLLSNQLFFLYLLLPPLLILYLISNFTSKLGLTLGKFSRLLIASSREFIADAEAVRMTKNPAALISALKRIDGRSKVEELEPLIDAMMIDGAVEGAYASHPTIAERIAVLSQHAGAMVHAAGTRKDTRSHNQFGVKVGGAFGRKIEETIATGKTPDKSLFKRVEADSNENAFGLTPRTRNIVLLAIAVSFAISSKLSNRMNDAALAIGNSSQHVSNKTSAESRANEDLSWIKVKKLATKLAAQDPLKARCFGHEKNRYHVGDWGREVFKKPDPARVKNILRGKVKHLSEIGTSNIVAMKIKSQRAVSSAIDRKSLNRAFWSYVTTRQSIMIDMHRFYGKKGLNWIRKVYQSPADRKIVKQLKLQYLQGKNISKNSDYYKDVALLVDNSKDFIPCYARALFGSSKASSGSFKPARLMKIRRSPASAPKISLVKTSMRGSN